MNSLLDVADMFAIDTVNDMIHDGMVSGDQSDRVRLFLRLRFAAVMESTAVITGISPPVDLTVVDGVYHSDNDDSVVCLSSWLPLVRNLKQ